MQFEEKWPEGTSVLWLDDINHAQHNMDIETELGEAVGRGDRPPLIRLWRAAKTHGIGVSRKDVASEEGKKAMETLKSEGYDVIVRHTGGTAVPQGPGVLHISYLFPRPASQVTTDQFYRILCNPMVEWLQKLGCEASTGALPGSFCDGSYNVLAFGRKLVGTAQAWRGGLAGMKSTRPGYVIAHACMVIDFDMSFATDLINRFYTLAGNPYRVSLDTSITLSDAVPSLFTGMTKPEATLFALESIQRFYEAKLQN